MSDPVTALEPRLGAPSPGQKRKRAVGDSTGERRTKRGAAAVALPADISHDFLDATALAVQASNVDLSALQQANEAASHADASHADAGHADAGHDDATDPAVASSTAAAALGSMYPAMQVSASPEQHFAEAATNGQEPSQDASFADVTAATQPDAASAATASISPPAVVRMVNGAQASPPPPRGDYQFRKPAVGTEEWHKLRKDNHKEGRWPFFFPVPSLLCLMLTGPVERRRRETINEGINELAKIVPNSEKNKGAILQNAVQFIQQMKATQSTNLEKWTLEKLLTEQAIAELTSANDKLKVELEGLYKLKEENQELREENRTAKEELKKCKCKAKPY
jgi:transcriptional regulator CBF1